MQFEEFQGLTTADAKEFASSWLPAWTGDQPEKLADFYSEDCFYSDAANPNGIRGRGDLLVYFKKLLARNPRWVWHQIDAVPMQDGFVNFYRAEIPVGDKLLSLPGVCLVRFDAEGKILRNEVFMDWSDYLRAARSGA